MDSPVPDLWWVQGAGSMGVEAAHISQNQGIAICNRAKKKEGVLPKVSNVELQREGYLYIAFTTPRRLQRYCSQRCHGRTMRGMHACSILSNSHSITFFFEAMSRLSQGTRGIAAWRLTW